ncbi:hypothetical protein Poli38472_007271 [Pythium oligandrum]|uniref:Amino acid permease n=1 Tax=Pythium oligandrum TaxID=41045 RepID=A0A8K1CA08_PYTOL|nr:hypothetical protein Poli38472_007271 [Pythium oligandrum]|eukprot:TMW59126.1 hypothetical protein Poli38472_007271 [Pythium oligandrum]
MILESPRSAFKDVFAKRQPVNHRVVGTLGMVSIIYLYTCAGPIGSEPIVSAGGPLAAMFALLVYPLLVTIPYAYIVAELCSAFPEDGGFTIWVLNAFGPYWGFQVGYWSWISGVIRTALIPDTILNLFLAFYDTKIESTAVELFVKAGIAIVLTFPACFGTRNATRLSCFLLVVVIVPFFTYTIWAYVKTSEVGEIFDVRHEVTYYDRDIDDAILEAIATVALLPISFDDLLPLSNAFAAAVEFTIIVAAMRLRMTLPYIPRPTKVPGGILGLLIFAGVPAVVLGYILVHTFMTSLIATLLMVGLLLFGLINGIWSTRWG